MLFGTSHFWGGKVVNTLNLRLTIVSSLSINSVEWISEVKALCFKHIELRDSILIGMGA